MSGAALQLAWNEASADYAAKAFASEQEPVESPDADRLINVECDAMDFLINKTFAPNLAAVAYKLMLAKRRAADFAGGLFEDHEAGISTDLMRLAGLGQPADAGDPHAGWLGERHAAQASADSMCDQAALDQASETLQRVEAASAMTPAISLHGLLAKLVMLVEVALEGHELTDAYCASAIHDAQRLAGLGSTQWAFEAGMRPQPIGTAA